MRFICFLILLFIVSFLHAGPENIAGKAKVSASTELNETFKAENVIDGIIGVDHLGEWACIGEGTNWGYIRYPWVQLEWEKEYFINKVILYDRPSDQMHTAGGDLVFSDGTRISVLTIPNDGSAKVIEFKTKKVSWVKFQVQDGDGLELGLSEIEVFPAPESYEDYTSWVNPFIETTRGRYFYFTPPARPFGMIAPGPVTRNKNQWGGGYNYNSTEILGFGNIHGWMLSGLELMPVNQDADPLNRHEGWKSSFSHETEIAKPGYYKVHLDRYKTWVEITSSKRVALYKMSYTRDMEASMLLSLGGYLGNSTMANAKVEKVDNHKVQGSFESVGRFWGGPEAVKIFFAIEFDQPIQSMDSWQDGRLTENTNELNETSEPTRRDPMDYGGIIQSYWDASSAGDNIHFSDQKKGSQLMARVSISYTGIDNAWNNLKSDNVGWNFEDVKEGATQEWNEMLGRIEVSGGSIKQRTKFYTDLWHVLLGRHLLDDASGDYPDYTQGERNWKFTNAELKVRQLPKDETGKSKYHMYNSDGIWLTQWNLNVLWGLAWPEVLDDFSASMVQYADNGGLTPRGPCAGGYSYIMTGNPATNMLVSTYMKGLMKKSDPKHVFETLKRNHLPGGMMGDTEEELQFYIDKGYCPGSAGKTLEFAFQDFALSQMARKLELADDYREFKRRSESWQNLFRPGFNMIFPKDENEKWLHDDPLSGEGWVEANSWQATWSVSHDISKLSELMGGENMLCEKLNYAFTQAASDDFVFGYSSGYVSYANQPGCSNAHVFNLAGQPWLSQYWVRRVNDQAYGSITPERGYGGHDEDQGQMGGVSALMSIGLFSVQGNVNIDPSYEITAPVFDEIKIKLNSDYYDGNAFVIKTHNNGSDRVYIQEARLNGKIHNKYWFSHKDFARGGQLDIWLGSTPNKSWGTAE